VLEDAIVANGITKNYGPITAVDHVDLRVPAGGIFGLLGPNGAGKTTIIKVLTGLSDLTSGEARVAGYDVRRYPMQVKQRIGWVAAEVILDDDFSGWENLWLQAKFQRLSGWQGRAKELLTYFSLEDRQKDKVSTYSTGMRKKLEIALALLHEPQVIFMDEPTIGLDPGTRRMLWELITGVNREYGITIFLTSHYIEEADALCGLVGIIDQGRIVAWGTPADLKAKVSGDFIEVETGETIDDGRLRSVPGVQQVRMQGATWVINVSRAEEVLPRLFATLNPGLIRRINVEKPSLESVYMQQTGKRIDQAEPALHDYRKFYANVRRARR
jgi:ABC-2 type transport system ATP-binding protein